MASAAAEDAVRNYLLVLKDPSSLRDEERVSELERQLGSTTDPVERVMLQQQLREAQRPETHHYEEAFVTHGKAWADAHGISVAAFLAEGVPTAVLRRAGFSVTGARGGRRSDRGGRKATGRSRVSAEQVRAALPTGSFTAKDVQEATGASPAVVRRVIQEETEGGNVVAAGPDPDHQGPGRAPVVYKR